MTFFIGQLAILPIPAVLTAKKRHKSWKIVLQVLRIVLRIVAPTKTKNTKSWRVWYSGQSWHLERLQTVGEVVCVAATPHTPHAKWKHVCFVFFVCFFKHCCYVLAVGVVRGLVSPVETLPDYRWGTSTSGWCREHYNAAQTTSSVLDDKFKPLGNYKRVNMNF